MKYQLDENYFDSIDSENKAYWIGFMSRDATTHRGGISCTLARKDRSHLEKFAKDISSTNPISDFESPRLGKIHLSSRFSFSNKNIQQSLKDLGLAKKKEEREIPYIVDELFGHFWRGVWDADGTICQKKNGEWSIGFCGNEKWVKAFVSFTGVDRKIENGKGCKMVHWYKKEDREKILHLLYDNATIYLDRKHKAIQQFLNWSSTKISKKAPIYKGFDTNIPVFDEILVKMSENPHISYQSKGETIECWHFPQEKLNITHNKEQKTVFISRKGTKTLCRL